MEVGKLTVSVRTGAGKNARDIVAELIQTVEEKAY